jgi:hypothetical protein
MTHAWAVSLAGLGAALLSAGSGRARLVAPILFLAIGCDLFLANRFVIPSTGREFYSLNGNLAEGLADDLRHSRGVVVVSVRHEDERLSIGQDPVAFFRRQRLAVLPFTGLELGLADAFAITSLSPADQGKWIELAHTGNPAVLLWSGINWALSPQNPPQSLPNPLPRVFMVTRARTVADQAEALKAASTAGFNPRQEVLVETRESNPPESAEKTGPPRIIREDNQTVEVEVKGPGWLVLLDSYYPGWRARVDGNSAPILRANVFFRAVWIKPGANTVVFSYWPPLFYLGAAISLATLFTVIIFVTLTGVKLKTTN